MKHFCLLILFLLILTTLPAYTWTPYGPPGVPISKADWHIPAVLSNGHIGLFEGGSWNYYTHSNLSVVDFTYYDSSKLMVILGSGSNSDGVYFFDFLTHNFQLLRWEMNPVFVKYSVYDSHYYVGGLEGLWKTTDGTDWTEVSIPGTGSVTDMAFYGTHYVVSKNNETWHSADGYSWVQAPYGNQLHGFAFNDEGVVLGLINSGTYSDGIWSSFDYGGNWSVIEYTLHLSCIGPKFGNNLTFGWLNGENSQVGVGMTVPGGDYILLNNGLTNLNINCIGMFDLINTPSFWVGTQLGAFYCTGFLTSNDDQTIPSPIASLRNYPNPFSQATTLSFTMPKEYGKADIEIYNIRGELIYTERAVQTDNIMWNGYTSKGKMISDGIYLCKLVADGRTLAAKSIVHIK